jgi:hypothetical protein
MSRINRCTALGAMIAVIAWSFPAFCQAQAPNTPPQPVPEDTGPGKSGSSSGPLSDKLDRSGGVIHPPSGVDPGMHRAPPPTGPRSTPVIPPPGTQGGKPEVEPR